MLKVEYLCSDESLKNDINLFLDDWNNLSDSITTMTSGSTGKPKSLSLLKSKMIESAKMTGSFFGLKAGDKAVLCLSPNTIAGKMMIVRSIVLKLHLIIVKIDSNPFEYLNNDIDFIAIVPLQLKKTLENSPEKLKNAINIIVGGGDISEELIINLKKNKTTVFHTFGMTETISHVAMRKIGYETEDFFTAIGDVVFSQKENTLIIESTLLLDSSIETNDSVELIDFKHFKWIGRKDFVINSGGVKIQPELVENKLNSLLLNPFFIHGMKHEALGEKVVLFIEGIDDLSINKEAILKLVSKYECPKEIIYISEFIRSESGKINRLKTVELIKGK